MRISRECVLHECLLYSLFRPIILAATVHSVPPPPKTTGGGMGADASVGLGSSDTAFSRLISDCNFSCLFLDFLLFVNCVLD